MDKLIVMLALEQMEESELRQLRHVLTMRLAHVDAGRMELHHLRASLENVDRALGRCSRQGIGR